MYYSAFGETECDKLWKFDEKTIERHTTLASRVLGIALQQDVNNFFDEIDDQLRGRLRNIKISGVYSESWFTKRKRRITEYCEKVLDEDKDSRYSRLVEWFYYHILYRDYGCSQLLKNQYGLMSIFVLVHFEEIFAKNPELTKNQAEFLRLTKEYSDCYSKHLRR